MTTIASEIERIQDAKADLKSSLNAKNDANHQITTQKISQYSSYADNIYVEPEEAEEKDINFYDYDGFRIASWTLDELGDKTTLPDNPRQHPGLVFEQWNWNLSQIKSNNTKANIGALYKTDDGTTRLYFDIPCDNFAVEVYLGITSSTSVTINWGDGKSSTRTDAGAAIKFTNTYAKKGKYVAKITINNYASGKYINFHGESSTYNLFGSVETSNYLLFNILYKIEFSGIFQTYLDPGAFNRLYNLRHVVTALETKVASNTLGAYTFYDCEGLECFHFPMGIITVGDYCFETCQALKYVTTSAITKTYGTDAFRKCYVLKSLLLPINISGSATINNYSFASCNVIKEFLLPKVSAIPSYALGYMYGVANLTIPSTVTTIAANGLINNYSFKELHFKSTTPPTVAASTAFKNLPTTCKIYVPSSALSAYKSATNYPSSSSYTYIGE